MMQRHATATVLAAVCAIGASQAGAISLGEFEYNNSCAQCHGADGTGDGPVTTYLRNVPPDLTQLASANGGVFPVTRVYALIEGTSELDVHGRDMPLWGLRYRERIAEDEKHDFALSPEDASVYARTRILSLIEYLAGIQQN